MPASRTIDLRSSMDHQHRAKPNLFRGRRNLSLFGSGLPLDTVVCFSTILTLVDHFSAQFVIGHGAFQAYLQRFALSDVQLQVCSCDEESTEDSSHTLLQCHLHAKQRSQLMETLYRVGPASPIWCVIPGPSEHSSATQKLYLRP